MARYFALGLALGLVLAGFGIASAAEIQWIHSLDEGLTAAQQVQKPIMVESYTDT